MSPFNSGLNLPQLCLATAVALVAASTVALGCECDGRYYGYHHYYRYPHRVYSCYGGGYNCGFESSYYYPYGGYQRAYDGCGYDCYGAPRYDGGGWRDWDRDDDD